MSPRRDGIMYTKRPKEAMNEGHVLLLSPTLTSLHPLPLTRMSKPKSAFCIRDVGRNRKQ